MPAPDPLFDDRDAVAGEFVLGLADDPVQAERLLREDPRFAAAVAAWQERLAPLTDEISAVEPPARVWDRIERSLPPLGSAPDRLRRRLGWWRGYGAAVTALAASLAILLINPSKRSQPFPPTPSAKAGERAAARPRLVAVLEEEEGDARFTVAVEQGVARLLITPSASELEGGRVHQLWLLPEGQAPVSLGVFGSRRQQLAIAPTSERQLQSGSALAVSIEPAGGSPTGGPTGAVIASGALAGL